MGAGVSNLGYDQGCGQHVLNGTTTRLLKGETVAWDTTTPVSTDKALRVRRLATADALSDVAGVLMADCPASGGYAALITTGRVYARVASDVIAGGLVVSDFTDSVTAGQLKNRGTVGIAYPVVGVALSAAARDPAGTGPFMAFIELAGLNTAAIQQVLRGSGATSNVASLDMIGKATGFEGYLRMPDMAGSIVNLEVLTETTITGDTANLWIISLDHTPFNGTTATCLLSLITGVDVVRGTPKVIASSAFFTFTARELMRVAFTVGAGAPATLAAVRLKFYATYDTGLQVPLLFGR